MGERKGIKCHAQSQIPPNEVNRGDIFFVAGSKYVTGSEPMGSRPAVIVSNDKGNKFSPNVEVVFLTSRDKKPMPTHVRVACNVPSIAMCENVQTVSKERLGTFVKRCTEEEMKSIDTALLCSFGITIPAPAPNAREETTDSTLVELNVYKTLYQQLLDRITNNL
jgi:mRNA interferase MazF